MTTTEERVKLIEKWFSMLEAAVPSKELLSNYLQGLILVLSANSDDLTIETVNRIQTFIIYYKENFVEDNLQRDLENVG